LDRRGTCANCQVERRLVDPPGPGAQRCVDCSGVADLLRCRVCNAEERPYRHGRCVRCSLVELARSLIGDIDGPLAPVYQAIISNPQPFSACNWVTRSTGAKILGAMAQGTLEISHEALDTYPQRKAADLLRHLLVANGVLEARDDQLVELETWVTSRLDEVSSRDHRRLLRSYATWRILRRTRERAAVSSRLDTSIAYPKTCLLAAIAFCEFLDTRGRSFTQCGQVDVDRWFDEGPPSALNVRDFLDWVGNQRLVRGLVVPKCPTHHGRAMDDDVRWAVVKRLLHDETIEIGDRVAGCLVLLYGQQISRIASLTKDQLTIVDRQVGLSIGPTKIDVPEPLAGMLTELIDRPRPYNGVATPTNTTWLFPGVAAGRPVNAASLGARLRRIGVPAMSGRRAALTHLAARLPAAVLADLLGIHVTTAVHWVQAVGGDWSAYAAQLVRESIASHAQ
jgi:hypothetical protein